ncbi:hypothetical protein NDI56_09470 [Haloarcula sp. S1CR25-12]|uniref:C2H2-type domain-containing protein n=1 Tax=Haloarcula saliterrae TaxID=2950534 RepID=A0ABU2FBG9_9EURY|nr:hypothetical protein [Haloarcula sp. S1CR25-12]MDS0259619.1 hypothetical protein [Haloarcula sp. S1CR25-12]
MEGVYHVVCHECPFEGLYTSATTATGELEDHEHEHGHRVSHLEINRPKPLTEA